MKPKLALHITPALHDNRAVTSTAAALRAGLLLSRRLDNDVVLEDGRAEDGHVAPPLVELSHLEGLFKDGAALVNVLRVKNLQKTIRYVFRLMVPTKKIALFQF